MAKLFDECFQNLGKLRASDGTMLRDDAKEELRQTFRDAVLEARQKGMSIEEAIRNAPQQARKKLEISAGVKQYRIAQQVLALTKMQDYAIANANVHRNEADSMLHALLEQDDLKSGIASVDSQADGLYQAFSSSLVKAIDAIDSKFFGLIEDKEGLRGFLDALFGGRPDPKFIAAAKAWGDTTEQLRQMANKLGAAIGKVSDIYVPQSWNAVKVGDYGRQAWAKAMLPHMDRSRYFNDDGSRMNDAEMVAFLEAAWTNVSTLAQPNAMQMGGTSVANRGAQSREIHLKDSTSWLEVNQAFGDGTLANMMDNHLRNVTRQIALMRQMGPKPAETVQALLDAGRYRLKDDSVALRKLEDDAKAAINALDWVMNNKPVLTEKQLKVQQVFRNLKAIQLFKLGFAPISSLTDNATIQSVAALNGMSGGEAFVNQLSRLNPAIASERALLLDSGILAQVHLEHAYNWGEQTLKSTLIERVGNSTMAASGMNWMTKARRESFSKMMQNHIGRWSRKPWSDLGEAAQRMLKDGGVTELDWQVLGKAKTVDWGNGETILGPRAILEIPDAKLKGMGDPQTLRENAMVNYMAYLTREGKRAVLEPSENTRRRMFQFIQAGRGTILGELAASVMQFKSFPVAMVTQNLRRALSVPGKMKYAHTGGLVLGTTLFGAIAVQITEMLRGKDPRNMADPKFWVAAMLKGGAMGLYGDFLFSQNTRSGSNLAEALAGPLIGTGTKAIAATVGVARRAAEGEDINPYDQITRVAAGMVPFYNWYTGAFFDHLLLQNVFEAANPGYLRRMQKKAKKDFGQEYFWKPGELTPDRAPEITEAWQL